MILVHRVDSTEEFAGLEKVWNGLLRISEVDTIFLTHQWLYSWWGAFENRGRLNVLLCYEDDGNRLELIGILPGYVRHDDWLPPTRRLCFLGSEVVTSDFLDVIIAPGREQAVLDALLTHLNIEGDAHLLELTDIREDSPLLGMLGAEAAINGWSIRRWPANKLCPVIDLPADWNSFLAGLSRSVRKNFQYYSRRLQGQGAEVEIVRAPEKITDALVDFRQLHDCRRKQKKQGGIFATQAQSQFYNDVLHRFAAAGWLELIFLKVAGKRVAVVCQFDYGNAAYYYQTGYDTAWEKSSVGFVLNGLLIERAISMRKSYYEFLRGEEDYKYRLGATRNRRLQDIYMTNGSKLGALYLARKQLISSCRGMVKRLLRWASQQRKPLIDKGNQ